MGVTTHVSAGRRRRRRLRRTVVALVTLLAVSGVVSYAAWHGSRPSRTPADSPVRAAAATAVPESARTPPARPVVGQSPSGTRPFAPVVTDRVPAPTTSIALSAPVPGTTNMQVPAARAVKDAFAAAHLAGLDPTIRSAWRSAEYQQVLFDRAVRTYGSPREAARWVLAPQRSAHVKGYAVDVQPQDAAAWLQANGAAFGLCRTYDNEWWHFEYLATSACPARLPSAAG